MFADPKIKWNIIVYTIHVNVTVSGSHTNIDNNVKEHIGPTLTHSYTDSHET